MLLALFGLLFMAIAPPLGLVFAVLALVFGWKGRGRTLRGTATNPGQAIAGIVLGAIAGVVSVGLLVSSGLFILHHQAEFTNLQRCLAHATTAQAKQVCSQEFNRVVSGH